MQFLRWQPGLGSPFTIFKSHWQVFFHLSQVVMTGASASFLNPCFGDQQAGCDLQFLHWQPGLGSPFTNFKSHWQVFFHLAQVAMTGASASFPESKCQGPTGRSWLAIPALVTRFGLTIHTFQEPLAGFLPPCSGCHDWRFSSSPRIQISGDQQAGCCGEICISPRSIASITLLDRSDGQTSRQDQSIS